LVFLVHGYGLRKHAVPMRRILISIRVYLNGVNISSIATTACSLCVQENRLSDPLVWIIVTFLVAHVIGVLLPLIIYSDVFVIRNGQKRLTLSSNIVRYSPKATPISTLRFNARPDAVLLSAIGWVGPRPLATMRSGAML